MEHFEEVRQEFLLEIKIVIIMDGILIHLVINFDQTGITYIPVSSWTMEVEGVKRVEVADTDDKRHADNSCLCWLNDWRLFATTFSL